MTDIVRDRATRLFQYLQELVQLRYSTVYDLDDYRREGDVLWLADIPQEQECLCALWEREPGKEPPEEYVEVSKPDLSPPPPPPKELSGWLDEAELADSSKDMPMLRETLLVSGGAEPPRELKLRDSPEIESKWLDYVEKKWAPWAGEDRRLKRVQDVYTRLFSMHQLQQQVGGAYEVVLGIGCLSWRAPNGRDIKRHLIVAQLELKFDARRGIMSVMPAAEGAKPKLEQEMLDTLRPSSEILQNVTKSIEDAGDFLLGNQVVLVALKTWHNAFDAAAAGRFDPSTKPASGFPTGPALHYAPAIILRQRTPAGLIRVFGDISESLRGGGQVPAGIRHVVDPAASEDSVASESPTDAILFPLPANEEQTKIAHQLTRASGVLVQGPPGTGKSHTIANLISHLLAHGKRVLVTSHGPQALAVLKGKLEEAGVAELCVFLLGNDIAAKLSLEKSVHSIAEHYEDRDRFMDPDTTRTLEENLDAARRDESETTQSIIKMRELESYRHGPLPGGYEGTAQEIAIEVADERGAFGWLADDIDPDAEPPMTDTEAQELLLLLRSTDEPTDEDRTEPALDVGDLPSPSDFGSAVRTEREAEERYQKTEALARHPAYAALVGATPDTRASLGVVLAHLREVSEALAGSPHAWVSEAATDILAGDTTKWRELHVFTSQQLEACKDAIAVAADAEVTGLAERAMTAVAADAEDLLRHIESGGRLGFWLFRPVSVKGREYLIDKVRVNGRRCRDVAALTVLAKWLELRVAISKLDEHWRGVAAVQPGPMRLQLAAHKELCVHLEKALGLMDAEEATREVLRRLGLQWVPAWHKPKELTLLGLAIDAAEAELALRAVQRWFDECRRLLRNARIDGSERELVGRLAESLDARDCTRYADSLAALMRLYDLRTRLRRRVELLSRLNVAAPRLADTLKSECDAEVWDGRAGQFGKAWNWGRVGAWLTRLSDPTEYQRLLGQVDRCRSSLLDSRKKLAVAKAWRVCLGPDRLTEHARMELMLWAEENRKVGKGTGKHAEKHRRAAQTHLDECRPAIPAWVMPIHRVADSVKPVPDAFDVAIIDEASQSGPECLFLQYIAKQVVVVGDPEQISPDEVGVDRTVIAQIRQRYIADVSVRDAIEPDTSYFGLAQVIYGNAIRLREHFRCMPEIIRFSNDLCYQNKPLIPLKQHGAGRLEPPVVARHVPDGYLDGEGSRTTNPPEAKAIVDEIMRCLGDEAYAGKTLGVICLLGHSQARLVDRLLKERVDADVIEKRQLICGEPYAFQGDERDVIFLSMVSAVRQGRIPALGHDRYKRAFNVAASRAKEQMWLFHSVTLNDLSQTCFRYRLLQFCLGGAAQQHALGPMPEEELRDLQSLARSAAREREDPPEPFDSWFEVDVHLELTQRGYRVRPQYETARYHIDLVVEGLDRRLAVECDGDQWHGQDRFSDDLHRQRMLERCGWVFWRIRGSDFYRARERTVQELLDRLERMDIVPVQRETELKAKRQEMQATYSQAGSNDAANTPAGRAAEGRDHQSPQTVAQARPAVPRPHGGITEYTCWRVRDLPDPRNASVGDVADGLRSIIETEGPVTTGRAYSLYAKGARLGRVARIVRRALDTALGRLIRSGMVDRYAENLSPQDTEQVIVVRGGERVVARTLGGRELAEVPLSELAKVLHELEAKGYHEEEPLFRRVLDRYGRAVLTHAATARLRAARRMTTDGQPADEPLPDEPGQRTFEL